MVRRGGALRQGLGGRAAWAAASAPGKAAVYGGLTSVVLARAALADLPSTGAAACLAAPAVTSRAHAAGDIMLYQYKICPFCNKLKAVMDYLGVQYKVTEVNPLTKKEIKFSEDYRKVPIVRMEEQVLIDSPEIISALLQRLREAGAMSQGEYDTFCSDKAQEWARWADKRLAVLLFPNITRNYSEAYQAFGYVWDVESFSAVDKALNVVLGSAAMWAAQGKLKKKYDIHDERHELFVALKDWTDALGDQPFLGGASPNLGDLSVFGCIKAIQGLDTHSEVLQQTGVGPWYARMRSTLGYDIA